MKVELKMKTERKPIQLAGINNDLYVLCDDGSIWYMGAHNDWIKMISIPKTDEPTNEENLIEGKDTNCNE